MSTQVQSKQKPNPIAVTVSAEEKAELREAARREGLATAAYIRRQALLAARGAPRVERGGGAAA